MWQLNGMHVTKTKVHESVFKIPHTSEEHSQEGPPPTPANSPYETDCMLAVFSQDNSLH